MQEEGEFSLHNVCRIYISFDISLQKGIKADDVGIVLDSRRNGIHVDFQSLWLHYFLKTQQTPNNEL